MNATVLWVIAVVIAIIGVVQLPGDRHRPFTDVAAVGGRTEEPERPLVGAEPGEEQDGATVALVVAIPHAGGAVGASGRLALPVDQRAADRVVAVPRRRREPAGGLVEGEREQLGIRLLGFVHAGLPSSDLGGGADAHGGEDLEARVAGVDLQRHVRVR